MARIGWVFAGAAALVASWMVVASCQPASKPPEVAPKPIASSDYVVLAWNDLGMHCVTPSYDELVILPPYNTLWAQVVRRGAPPKVVTDGLTVSYRVLGNTHSHDKGAYGGFWAQAKKLFDVELAPDRGLNLVEPLVHNGLEGTMARGGTEGFVAYGIPLTPLGDDGSWNPYQIAEVTVRDASGAVVATTRATLPVSDEIDCSHCHGAKPFTDILAKHDTNEGTALSATKPVLCAACHGDPALGAIGPGSAGSYLSEAIHRHHADVGAACYDCHPGAKTECSRSLAHTGAGGNCTACHGELLDIANSIDKSGRMPWVREPSCEGCHPNILEVDVGEVLYRNAHGHGGLSCPACHGSPHAMVPSRVASDNFQSLQYQSAAYALGSCRVCHPSSMGGGSDIGRFEAAHGTASPKAPTACHVCHVSVRDAVMLWPHSLQWKKR